MWWERCRVGLVKQEEWAQTDIFQLYLFLFCLSVAVEKMIMTRISVFQCQVYEGPVTWKCLPAGPPPSRGVSRVWGDVDWVVVQDRSLAGPIPDWWNSLSERGVTSLVGKQPELVGEEGQFWLDKIDLPPSYLNNLLLDPEPTSSTRVWSLLYAWVVLSEGCKKLVWNDWQTPTTFQYDGAHFDGWKDRFLASQFGHSVLTVVCELVPNCSPEGPLFLGMVPTGASSGDAIILLVGFPVNMGNQRCHPSGGSC